MLKTDFNNTKGIVFSFPDGYADKEYLELTSFYISLFNLIPKEIELVVIGKSKDAFNLVFSKELNRSIKFIQHNTFEEIWLKDNMGIKSSSGILLPQYKPDYFRNIYTNHYLKSLRKNIKELHKKLGNHVVDLEIIMDGGNFVTNGKVALMTDKIVNDNPTINIQEYFKSKLNLEVLLIKQSKYDFLGHSDGCLSFINEDTLMISKYPIELDYLKEDRIALNNLKEELKDYGFNMINLYERPIDEKVGKKDDFLYGATGIYVNNILLNETVILPEFTIPSYKTSINHNKVNKSIYEDLGYTVKTINTDLLGKQGGGLHCISWCY